MTEEEAKNKVCCGTAQAGEWTAGIVVDGQLRRASPDEQANPDRLTYFHACRASGCMAWRAFGGGGRCGLAGASAI